MLMDGRVISKRRLALRHGIYPLWTFLTRGKTFSSAANRCNHTQAPCQNNGQDPREYPKPESQSPRPKALNPGFYILPLNPKPHIMNPQHQRQDGALTPTSNLDPRYDPASGTCLNALRSINITLVYTTSNGTLVGGTNVTGSTLTSVQMSVIVADIDRMAAVSQQVWSVGG